MKLKFANALSLALIMAMLFTSVGLADPIVNNIDTTVDPVREIKNLTAGNSTTVGFFDVSSNNDPTPGDASGCNSTGGSPATVTLSVPSGVTASPMIFNLVGCGTANAVSVSFTSNTPGDYDIDIASVTGGKSGSQWNTSPAGFTLHVTSSNTATTTTVSNASATFGDASVTLSATVSPNPGGGSVSFSVDGSPAGSGTVDVSGVAAVSYNPSSLNAGSHTIQANFGASGTFLASSGTGSLAIGQASSTTTVTCGVGPFTYTGSAQMPCSASVTGVGGLSQTLTVNYSNNTNAGPATASASFAGDTNHTGSSDTENFAIGQASSTTTVTCNAGPFTYNGSAFTPCSASYTTSDGLSGSLTVGYSDNTNAGTASASATYAGDANHAGSSDTENFAIGQASSTTIVTCNAGPFTYNGSAFTPCSASYTTSDGLSGSLTVGYSDNTNAGTATASATYAGDANHAGSSDTENFAIGQADAVCVISGYTGVYDGAAHGATGSCTGVGDETLAGLDLGASFTNVPGGMATWTFTDVTGNYNNASGTAEIAISKADATIVVNGYTGVYDGAAHGAMGSATGVLGEPLTGLDLGASFTNVPGGTANWTFTDVTGNYNNASGTAEIAISKADATIVVNGYTGVYDGAAHGAMGSATGVLGEPLTGLDLGATFTNVPGGTATWTFTDVTGNYNNASDTAAIVISKADATIVVNGYTGVYDGAAHGATGSATGVLGESLAGLDLGASFTNVPGGTANWTFTDVTGNYNNASDTAAIVISKADATIVVNGYTGVYDGAAHGATGSVMGVLGEPLAGLDLGATFTNVPGGTANWTFTDATGNYNSASGTAAIVISKANATCTVTGYNVLFDNADHTATGSCTGVLGESLATLNLSGTTHKLAGTYNDTWTFTDVTGNYNNTSGTVIDKIGAWTLRGFHQPVDMGGVYNTVRNGSTVPLKFEIFAGSTELTDIAAVQQPLVVNVVTCQTGVVEDLIETVATGGTSLRYDTSGGQFIYNWKTPSTAGKCYRVTMTALDGSSLVAFFKLK